MGKISLKGSPLEDFKHLQKLFKQYQREAEEDLVAAQIECKHEKVWEIPYHPFDYGGSMPPYRLCCNCGYQEQGWYCGYNLLDKPEEILKGNREIHKAASNTLAHMMSARYEDGNRDPFGKKVMECLKW